jgi:predicted nucleic acid-binding protein
MKLAAALAQVTTLGLDTPPFIYFIERHPVYLDLVREIFRRIDAGTLVGCCSAITLTEVLTQPKRIQDQQLESEYRNLLTRSRNLTLLPINARMADIAADLRARYRLRTPDALQIATALEANCEAFLTNDTALQRVQELRILVLNQLEL